jgi:hypothetical protein
MMNADLTLPAFRSTLAAWQIIVSTIGTDPFIQPLAFGLCFDRLPPNISNLCRDDERGLTLPAFRRTIAAWQIIVSTIGTDPFTIPQGNAMKYDKI